MRPSQSSAAQHSPVPLRNPKVYHIVNVVIVAAAVAVVFVVTYLQECAYVNFKWRTRYDEGC